MIHGNDILLDANDDLLITNGDLTIGDSVTQEIGILLRLSQGDLKSDPLLGPNLVRMINGKESKTEARTAVKLHLARDGKDYEDVKSIISINNTAL